MRTEEEIREELGAEGGYGERGLYSAGYEKGYHSALEWALEPSEEEAIIPERCLECPYYKEAIKRTLDPPPFRQDDHPIESPAEPCSYTKSRCIKEKDGKRCDLPEGHSGRHNSYTGRLQIFRWGTPPPAEEPEDVELKDCYGGHPGGELCHCDDESACIESSDELKEEDIPHGWLRPEVKEPPVEEPKEGD
jgi:hypothetical protein